MNNRKFNRQQQKKEMDKVVGKIREDHKAADGITRQHGPVVDLAGLKDGLPADPVPAPTWQDNLTAPVQIPAPSNVIPLQSGRQKHVDGVPEDALVVINIDLPPNVPQPTHIRFNSGEEAWQLIPQGILEDMMNIAFNRGYQRMIDVYAGTHKLMRVPPVLDPLQLTYCQMVQQGMFELPDPNATPGSPKGRH